MYKLLFRLHACNLYISCPVLYQTCIVSLAFHAYKHCEKGYEGCTDSEENCIFFMHLFQ